jgi:DNA-binding MarR family transcriptional regulator
MISIAKQYMEVFKLECKQGAKNHAMSWVNKLKFLEDDILSAITPESRERFRQEIKQGDTLFFDSMFELLIHLTPEQRETIEEVVKRVAKGESLNVEYVNQEAA